MKVSIIFIIFFTTACGSSKMYPSHTNWDANRDNLLNQYEFISGYLQSDLFLRWSKGKSALSYSELFTSIFEFLDGDKDVKLSPIEFNSQIEYFYFGSFSGSFEKWDRNSDASIDLTGFSEHASKSNLASKWDTSNDKQITERELAAGMFYLADPDSNGRVDLIEFNVWLVNRKVFKK